MIDEWRERARDRTLRFTLHHERVSGRERALRTRARERETKLI